MISKKFLKKSYIKAFKKENLIRLSMLNGNYHSYDDKPGFKNDYLKIWYHNGLIHRDNFQYALINNKFNAFFYYAYGININKNYKNSDTKFWYETEINNYKLSSNKMLRNRNIIPYS